MGYLKSIYNNTRYIVFIQTKYHQNILPADDVSGSSLKSLFETIGSYRGGHFRSIRIYRDDITTLRIYERNFTNYKDNVLKISENWKYIYQKLGFFTFFLDLWLYNYVFLLEINKFGNTITNSKPKYLIDKTDIALKIIYGIRKEYHKNNDGKEIIKHVDFHNGNLVINEEIFDVDKNTKSGYFLSLFSTYAEKENNSFITLYDFIDIYEKNYNKDNKEYNYLNLSNDNIKNSYIKTINKHILEKYNKEVLEINKGYIGVIQE